MTLVVDDPDIVEGDCNPSEHDWVTQRCGGDPAELGSYELVCYCRICGTEWTDG